VGKNQIELIGPVSQGLSTTDNPFLIDVDVSFSGPGGGLSAIDSLGVVTYTPDTGFVGDDGFTFEVDDGYGGTDIGTVSITVTPVNDTPVAQDGSASTDVGTPVDILLLASDVDGDTLSYQVVDLPTDGTLSGDDADQQVIYTPDVGFTGSDSFSFEVSDGTETSNVATVTVTVGATGVVFEDAFDRADGPLVGNGWVESELAQVAGVAHIAVVADVDAKSYEVRVDNVALATGLPFHHPVVLDTVRFFTDALNEQHFGGLSFDAVVLRRP